MHRWLKTITHLRSGYRWVLSNDGLVIITGNPKKQKKNYYIANWPRIYKKNHLGLNKKLCNEKPASNRLSYSTALITLAFKRMQFLAVPYTLRGSLKTGYI